jgi:tetratricopeptide (TPR) repeat protein
LIKTVGLNVLTFIAVLLIGVAFLIAFKGRDLYRAFEKYQAGRIADQAMIFIKAERWESASQLLQDAVRRMPDQAPLLRAVADLFAKGYNDPQTAATFLRRLISKTEGTPQDQRRLAEVLLQGGDVNEARHLYSDLPPAEQTSRKGLELLSTITRTAGNVSEADQILRKALMLDPDDKDARLRLAIMDEAQAMDDARVTVAESIWKIAGGNDEIALRAIEHLASSKSLTAGRAKELKLLVEKNPSANDRVRYIALQAQIRLNPLDHDGIVAAEVFRNKGKSPDNMFDFLRWLGQQGEHQKILDLVPAESVARDADVFLIYVEALASSERWKELLNLMTTRKTPITEATAHVILAQCYSHLQPDLKETRRHLSAALSSGKRELAVLVRAAAFADSLHLNDLALQGYKIIGEARPAMRIQALEKTLELYRADRNPVSMLNTLHQLHDLRPRNRGYIDQLTYLRLVTGTELELAYEDVIGFDKPAADDSGNTLIPNNLLRALAALRFGNIALMKEEVAKLGSIDQLPAGIRATIAGLLAISGRDVEGYRIGEKILPAGLLKEELVFLRRGMAN